MRYEIIVEDSYDNNKKIMSSYPAYFGDDFRACLYYLAVDLFVSTHTSIGGYDTRETETGNYWTMEVISDKDIVDMKIKEKYNVKIKVKKDIDFK